MWPSFLPFFLPPPPPCVVLCSLLFVVGSFHEGGVITPCLHACEKGSLKFDSYFLRFFLFLLCWLGGFSLWPSLPVSLPPCVYNLFVAGSFHEGGVITLCLHTPKQKVRCKLPSKGSLKFESFFCVELFLRSAQGPLLWSVAGHRSMLPPRAKACDDLRLANTLHSKIQCQLPTKVG